MNSPPMCCSGQKLTASSTAAIAGVTEMAIPVRQLLREKGTPYAQLGLADPKWTDDELLDFMQQHPILINRPVVRTALGAKLCRPSEAVLELLPVARLLSAGRRRELQAVFVARESGSSYRATYWDGQARYAPPPTPRG